jgi:ATP-binding cassette subfamily B protein
MVAKHHGRSIPSQELREAAEIGKDGVNLLGIAQAAEGIGFRTLAVKITLAKLRKEAPLPCIIHWGQNHFVVVTPKGKKGGFIKSFLLRGKRNLPPHRWGGNEGGVVVADPAGGNLITYTAAEFESQWATSLTDGEKTGIALLLEPTPAFNNPTSSASNP